MVRKDSLSGQRYACDRPGCDKHYSRPDHLLRHKLNHDREKILACTQCDRTFVRQDLLARHLERHALRGKTLGRWSGRQSEGSPSGTRAPSSAKRRRRSGQSKRDDEIDQDDSGSDEEQDQDAVMGQPSTSIRSQQEQHYSSFDQSNLHPAMRQSMGQDGTHNPFAPTYDRYDPSFAYVPPPPQSAAQQYGFQSTEGGSLASGPSASSAQAIAPPLPYENVFDPHQGSPPAMYGYGQAGTIAQRHAANIPWDSRDVSQGAPLTSAPAGQSTQPDWSSGVQANAFTQTPALSQSTNVISQLKLGSSSETFPAEPFSDTMALLDSTVPGSSHFPFFMPSTNDFTADYDWLFDGTNPLMSQPQNSFENGKSMYSEATTSPSEARRGDMGTSGSPGTTKTAGSLASPTEGNERGLSQEADASEPADALRDLAFFAILQRDIPDEPAFDVDQATGSRLLHFLSSLPELATSPLFSPAALRCYLHLFFTRLNAIYPLIHQPTFSAKSADAMLLSSMIVCGAHFADESAHFLAEKIGRKLWGAFISFEDFRPARATLAMLQAMLITETFGKMMGTRPQHETAHLFHNFIVTLARRNAVFIQSKVKLPSDPHARWKAWAREEEKKRISLYSFLLDAQHATIFRHTPALSSFQIHLQLPCGEDEWHARNAQEWAAIRQSRQGETPNFIAALKAALTQDDIGDPDVLSTDGFKQVVLLHGLMSVAYDLQWKQQALLTAPDTSENISNWKERLIKSYESCKRRLDSKSEPSVMDKASHSLIEWAQIVLHSDSVDIQIYAGLPTVMGRFIDHHTFSVARKSCREWAKTEDARTALYHAARFLRSTLLPKPKGNGNAEERSSVSGVDFLLHHQWVQYLSSLVIWAYGQALSPLKTQNVSRGRSQDRDSVGSAPITGDVGDGMLQEHPTLQAHTNLSKRIPDDEAPIADKATREASIYLDYVGVTPPTEMTEFDPPQHYSTAVLELVEKECRGSRWELGREASGVLRKLIRERQSQANNA